MIRKTLAWLLSMTCLMTMIFPQAAPAFASSAGDANVSARVYDTGIQYLVFRDGEQIEVAEDEAAIKAEDYDGTVKVSVSEAGENGEQTVTLLPEAAEGREFSLLTLTAYDSDGKLVRSVSPVSRDYRYDSDQDKAAVADGNYSVTIQLAAEEGTNTSLTFAQMPAVTAWFDTPYAQRIDPKVLIEKAADQKVAVPNKGAMTKSIGTAISAVGRKSDGEGWGSTDYASGDYVVFDAGEGQQFTINEIVAYGRPRFAHDRFGGLTVFYSNDNQTYTPILETKHLSKSQQYETARASFEGNVYARYIKISSSTKNLNISCLNFYGAIEEDQTAYYELKALVEQGEKIERLDSYQEANWNEFAAALSKASDLVAAWEQGGEGKPESGDLTAAASALSTAMERLGEGKKEYLAFKDGRRVETKNSPEDFTEDYDGYVEVQYDVFGREVSLLPVAADGREFSLLTLTARNEDDSILRSISPVSRDYRYNVSGGVEEADDSYGIGIQTTGTDGGGTSLAFAEMPDVTAYFDKKYAGNLLNEQMTLKEEHHSNQGKPAMNQMLETNIAAAGGNSGEGWNAGDHYPGDYAIFYAGDDKQYTINEIVAYGRVKWAHNRFWGLNVAYSVDGVNYTTVLETQNLSEAQMWETARASYTEPVYAKYIKITGNANPLNISRLNFYGVIEDDRIEYYALKQLVEKCLPIEEAGQSNYRDAQWKAFTEALAAAKVILTAWDSAEKPTDAETQEAADALTTALEELGDGDKQYLAFKDGVLVETQDSPDKLTKAYDGYVEVVRNVNGTDVSLLPVAADGREFSLLTLTVLDRNDSLLRSISPVSRDYRYNVSGGAVEANGDYEIGIQLSDADGGGTSLTFAEMPGITAWFDQPNTDSINSEMLQLVDPNQDYQVKPSRGSMSKMLSSSVAAAGNGAEAWSGTDRDAGDYTVFYAGEGRQFTVDQIVAYSRPRFTHNRFWGLGVAYSNDGENWTTVFETQNLDSARQWETGRQSYEKPIYARYIKLSSYANNLDISRLDFYGELEEDRIEYCLLNETVQEAKELLDKGEQDYHVASEWDEFEAAYEAAEELLTTWKAENRTSLTDDAREALSAADKNLSQALIRVKVSFLPAGSTELLHPAIGNAPADLKSIREHVFDGDEPWASFYEQFSQNTYASKNYQIRNDLNPGGEELVPRYDYPDYAINIYNGDMGRDATAAYYQSIMYFLTGEDEYRETAIRILRLWSMVNPENVIYASPDHIHHASPVFFFNCAAELLRYTSASEEDLVWTQADTDKYITNYLEPIMDPETGWFDSNTNWFNQHQTVLYARMSSMIFMDDVEGYEEVVEWFTVNASVGDLFHNGSITNAMPLLDKDVDGTPVDPYVAVGEMSRDQPHAYENVRGLSLVARIVDAQGDKVDPVDGTVSEAADAVSVYDFMDERLVKGANYWCQYNLGHEDMPFWNTRGDPIADSARGRYYDVFEYYIIYKFAHGYEDDDPDFRYVAEEVERNRNLSGNPTNEIWLYFPEEAEGKFTYQGPVTWSGYNELEYQSNWFCDGVEYFSEENGDGTSTAGIEIDASQSPTVAILNFYDTKAGKMALRYRSNGNALLEIKQKSTTEPQLTQVLPDTDNEWRYILLDATGIGTYADNQIYFYTISSEDQVTVFFDHIITKDTTKTPPQFVNGKTENNFYYYPGMSLSAQIQAVDSNPDHSVTYHLRGNAPEGLTVENGVLTWNVPENAAEDYSFLLVADDGESISVTEGNLSRVGSYGEVVDAICGAYSPEEVYETATKETFDQALEEARAATEEEQNAALANLQNAVDGLRLLNPSFTDDQGVVSLDYRDLLTAWYDNNARGSENGILPILMDGEFTTFAGDVWNKNNKAMIFDFGVNFRFCATEFRFGPRKDFVGRSREMVVFGSVDGVNWTPLTDFTVSAEGWQTVPVFEDEQNNAYRYFMVKQLTANGVEPMSFSELRMVGERSEITDLPTAISISSDNSTSGTFGNVVKTEYRAGEGDTITVRFSMERKLTGVQVTIENQDASVTETPNGDGTFLYTASVTLASQPEDEHDANFSIQYQNQDDDSMCEPIRNAVTDGSTVWVADDSNAIDVVGSGAVMWNNRAIGTYFDNDRSTMTTSIQTHEMLVFEFPEGTDVQLDRLEILPGGYSQKYDSFASVFRTYIQGSEDGETWRNIARYNYRSTGGWASYEVFDYDKTKNYRFFRISTADLSEVRFYGEIGQNLEENLYTYTVKTSARNPEGGTTQVYFTNNPENAQDTLTGIKGGDDVTIKAIPNPGYKFVEWVTEKSFFGVDFDYHFAKDSGPEYVLQYDQGDYQGGLWYREVIEDMDLVAVFEKLPDSGEEDDDDEPGSGSGSSSGGSSGTPLPTNPDASEIPGEVPEMPGSGDEAGASAPNAQPDGCVSDTVGNFAISGAYQYRLTTTDGTAPVVTVDSSNFRVQLVSQDGSDYFVKVYAVGAPGQTCNVYVNGVKVSTVTAETVYGGVMSDTTAPFAVQESGAYQFKLTAAEKPTLVAGSNSFRVELAGNNGNEWFFKAYAVGKPGDGCGFYINGAPIPVAVAHIAG